MNASNLNTVDQLKAFLDGSQAIAFAVSGNKHDRYQWIGNTLIKFQYQFLCRRDKGVLIQYLMEISGYSRQQITRLIKQYTDKGRPKCKHRPARGFSKRYTDEDVRLLAHMDRLHNTPNGLTLKKLCERAYQMFNQTQYQRLAGISIAHLSNLDKSKTYLRIRRSIMYKDVRANNCSCVICTSAIHGGRMLVLQAQKPVHLTRPKASSIGQRRIPTGHKNQTRTGNPGIFALIPSIRVIKTNKKGAITSMPLMK